MAVSPYSLYILTAKRVLMPWDWRNIITWRMARCSVHACSMLFNFFFAIPGTSISLSMECSNTSRVSLLKWRTIFFAVLGPTPLIRPDPRYFSRAAVVAGFFSSAFTARNWRPYLGWTLHDPLNSMVAPANTFVWWTITVSWC